MKRNELRVENGGTPELWLVYAGKTRIGSVYFDRERGGWTPIGAFAINKKGQPVIYPTQAAAVVVLEEVYAARLEAYLERRKQWLQAELLVLAG